MCVCVCECLSVCVRMLLITTNNNKNKQAIVVVGDIVVIEDRELIRTARCRCVSVCVWWVVSMRECEREFVRV